MTHIPGNLSFYRFDSTAILTCTMFCGTTSADVIHTVSDIKGAQLIPLGAPLRSPENGSLDEDCKGFRAKKLGAEGRQVASLGWIVTSEVCQGVPADDGSVRIRRR